MKKGFGLLFCLLVLSTVSHGQMAIDDEIKVAKLLMKSKQHLEAIGHFNAILIRDPENLEAHLFRAGAFVTGFDEAERAQKDLDFCIQANYRHVQTTYYRAKILFQEGKYREAVREFDKVSPLVAEIELHPADEVYYFSGLARASAEDYEGAIRDYNYAQSYNALDYSISMMRAESELALNHLDAATVNWSSLKQGARPKGSYFTGKSICDPYKLAIDAALRKFANIQGKLIEANDFNSSYSSTLGFPEAKSAELLVIKGMSAVLQVTYLKSADTEFDLRKSYDELILLIRDCLSNSGFMILEQGTERNNVGEPQYTFKLYNTDYPLDDALNQVTHGILITISMNNRTLMVSIF